MAPAEDVGAGSAGGVDEQVPAGATGDPLHTEAPSDVEVPLDADAPLESPARSSRARAGWRAVTTRGRATALVAVVSLLLGAATGWREWIGVAAALAVLLAAAAVMSVGRSSVAVDLVLPRNRFVVCEPGSASIRVRNTSNRRMLPMRMELEVAGIAASVPVPSLHGGASHAVDIPLPTGRRAAVELGPLRAVRGDVFGLIRRVVHWPLRRQVFVHPRTIRPSSSLPGYLRDLEGEESTKRTASDLSFHTLREYVPGDDMRFIHWKSTARNGTLQVREFLQTHRSLVAVVLSGNRGDYHWADDARGSGGLVTAVAAVDGGENGVGRGGADDERSGGDPPDEVDPDDADRVGSRRARPGGAEDEFEVAVSCAASMVAELVRQRRSVVTDAAGTDIRGATAEGVLDQFCAVEAAPESPDLIFETRRMIRRFPRASLIVLVFGSAVGAAQVRAAVRACPVGAGVLALRARSASSPHPSRLTGSDAHSVHTVADVDALPAALRAA